MNDIVFGIRLKSNSAELVGDLGRTEQAVKRTGEVAQKSFQQAGISAGQMQAAMRGLPAQFTDIFTSLASGQAPITVLLQQGGQLKDMFGGVGPAARAMGGYIAGLVNPLALAAAAVATLGVAWAEGDAESARYRKALALTGHAAGVTADQLRAMSKAAAEAAGSTQGSAGEVMVRLAESGRVAADVMPQVGAAITAMAATGAAEAEDLVKAFAEIAKEPVKGITKLNEAYNFLEPVVLSHIASLQAQGKEEEAIALAQQTAAKAVLDRAEDVRVAGGVMERAWDGVAKKAAEAWAKVTGAFADKTLKEQIAETQASIKAIEGNAYYRASPFSNADKELAELQARLTMLKLQESSERAWAQAQRERKETTDALIEAQSKAGAIEDKALARTRTMADAMAEYHDQLEAIRRIAPDDERLNPDRIAKVEAGIRAQFETVKRAATEAKKPVDEIAKALDKWYDARQAGIATLDDEIAAERAAREAMGLTRAEVVELEAAKLDLAGSAKDVEAANLSEAATFAGPLADAYRKAAADAEQAAEKMRELAAEKRATADALRQQDEADAASAAREAYVRQLEDAAKDAEAVWQHTSEAIGQTFFDILTREGANASDAIEGLFKDLVLRPTIQGAVDQVTGTEFYQQNAGALGAAGLAVGAFDAWQNGDQQAAAAQAGAAIGSYWGPWGTVIGYLAGTLFGGMLSGGTSHQGGAAFADVGGGLDLATAVNTPGFGLDWGAYRAEGSGDRSPLIDRGVLEVVSGTSNLLRDRAAQYGGDASGLRVLARFASDNDDPSVGAYRVTDANGGTVFDRSGRYASDPQAGFQQFGQDALRAQVAALQSLELDQVFEDLLAAVDPLADSTEVLTMALEAADEIARQRAVSEEINATLGRDAMEDARVAALSAASAWFESAENIRAAASSGALSVDQMAQLAADHYANQVRLLSELQAASDQVAGMFADTASGIEYQALQTDQARYNYLQDQADQILDVISGLMDPDEIIAQSQRLQQTVGQAFGLLAPDQQAAEAPRFLEYLEAAETFVQDRIDAVTDSVLQEQQQTADVLANATVDAINRGVAVMIEDLRRAGDAIPSSVDVHITVTQPPPVPIIATQLGDGP